MCTLVFKKQKQFPCLCPVSSPAVSVRSPFVGVVALSPCGILLSVFDPPTAFDTWCPIFRSEAHLLDVFCSGDFLANSAHQMDLNEMSSECPLIETKACPSNAMMSCLRWAWLSSQKNTSIMHFCQQIEEYLRISG